MKKVNCSANKWSTTIVTLFFMILCCFSYAQTRISGRITDSATTQPLADASVYIANSTIGTKTDKNGEYAFSKLNPGAYELIVSCVGYQSRMAAMMINAGDNAVNIALSTRSIELKEVTITAAGDWKHNLALFKREFIGTSNAQECEIANPEVLNLSFSNKNNRLTASSDDFMEIENKLLGYKLRFLVKDFWADYNTGKCHYSGSVIFEELKGSKSELRKWTKNRQNAYSGSFTHFLVALGSNQLKKEKFVVYKMNRTINPDWQADNLKSENKPAPNRRLTNGQLVTVYAVTPLKTIETLDRKPLTEADMVKPGEEPGTFKLQFDGYIYVIYKNKRVTTDGDDLHRQPIAEDYQMSAASLKNLARPILFDANGTQLTREGLLFEGAWDSRIVDLLPFDYVPDKSN